MKKIILGLLLLMFTVSGLGASVVAIYDSEHPDCFIGNLTWSQRNELLAKLRRSLTVENPLDEKSVELIVEEKIELLKDDLRKAGIKIK